VDVWSDDLKDPANQDPHLNPRDAAADPVNAAADERRTEDRIPHRAIVVMPFGEGVESEFKRAMMVDCSLHGIALIVDQPFRPRTRFFVKLKLTTVALVVYEVKYCQEMPHGYRIGADLQGISGSTADCNTTPEAIMHALLAT
jgi:hypothetical protein